MAGEVLHLNSQYWDVCQKLFVSSCEGIPHSAEVPGPSVSLTFPHHVYPCGINPHQVSFGMLDFAVQHSPLPGFSICSFSAPLQQQQVSPFPSPVTSCWFPQKSPNIISHFPHRVFSAATTSLESPAVADVSSPSQLLTAFWIWQPEPTIQPPPYSEPPPGVVSTTHLVRGQGTQGFSWLPTWERVQSEFL